MTEPVRIRTVPVLADKVSDGSAQILQFQPVKDHPELVDIKWTDGKTPQTLRTSRSEARVRGIAA